jgi:threonine synthase
VQSERELKELAPREAPPTIQAKIAMTFPPDGLGAIAAVRESGGLFLYASDGEALLAQHKLGASEGIYAEPSAAVALVGAEKLLTVREVDPRATIVAVVTGSGFRETGALSGQRKLTRTPVDRVFGMEALEGLLRR